MTLKSFRDGKDIRNFKDGYLYVSNALKVTDAPNVVKLFRRRLTRLYA